jgi:hypothetical protein
MAGTSNTKKYYEIARDCLRSAQDATSPEARDKLLKQSQVWMDAAMRETFIATIGAGDPREPYNSGCRAANRSKRCREGQDGRKAPQQTDGTQGASSSFEDYRP